MSVQMTDRIAMAAAVLVAVVVIEARPAAAEMPRHVQDELDRIGYAITPQMIRATYELYVAENRKAAKGGVKATRDVAYGSSPLQTLDVHPPENRTAAPVVVFVHGGGFVEGNKTINAELFSNVPTYFARHGLVGVNMNYRLAPAAAWPAGAQDVGSAVAWLKDHAVEYSGDPARIFLLGYSAGATHVASYIFDRSLQPASGSGVAGAIVLSGVYEVHPNYIVNIADNLKAYFGADESQYDSRSPLSHVPGSSLPVLVARAEHDPWYLGRGTEELKKALCNRDGRCPPFVQLEHHSHISAPAAINTSDDQFGREVLAFVRDRG